MRKKSYTSHSEMTNLWLASKVKLAGTSRMAYRGEVLRMSEHLEGIGIHTTSDVSREEWWNYLASLSDKRDAVSTKRCDELKIGSIHQARRITRDFFRWALDGKIIDWFPRLPDPAIQDGLQVKEDTVGQKEIDKNLIKILLGTAQPIGLKESRTHMIFNLIFWGALKPAELIALSISDLSLSKNVLIHSRLQDRSIHLPNHIADIWERYIQNRKMLLVEPLKHNDPLISQLDQNRRLSGWSIWSAFQEWQQKYGSSDDKAITPRALRSKYQDILCEDGESKLKIACALSGINERVVKASREAIPDVLATSMQHQIIDRLTQEIRN